MTNSPQLRQRLTAAATAGGTLAVTLVLLAGMPYVLWRAAGLPWPDHAASLSDLGPRLMQPVSDPLMIQLLAVVGWVCWAAFAWTVVRETVWYVSHVPQLVRDRHAHDEHVAALSVRGSLAALCVGTLVVALIGLWRSQPVSAQPTSPGETHPGLAASAPLVPGAPEQPLLPAALLVTPEPAAATSPAAVPSASVSDAEPTERLEYTVVEGDTLWDIARTHLGDSLKWPRIYALNKDRVQDDGGRLNDPDQIMPGWHLTIPVTRDTAHPPASAPQDVRPSSAPPAQAPPAQAPSANATPGQDTGDAQQGSGGHRATQSDRHDDTAARKPDTRPGTDPGPAAIGLGEASLIGITAAAGLLAARRYWYRRQHRLREPGRQAAVPALSPLVDKAAQAAHEATRPPRPPDPDALVTRRTPPRQPGSASTVTIGVRDGAEVPLDELATPAGCTWTGPGAEGAARALLAGILTAAERQRPAPARVSAAAPEHLADRLLPGLPTRFTALTQSADTAEAIRAAEHHLLAHARSRDEHDTHPEPDEASDTGTAPDTDPGTLLLLAVPDAATSGQLQALAARSHPDSLIVLTLDTPIAGTETWHVADDGTTTCPHAQHSDPLRLFHLTPESGRDMTDVLLTAHGERPRLRIIPGPSTSPDDERPNPQPAPPPHEAPLRPCETDDESRPPQTKPVRLHVLGPVTLYARGHPDPVGTNLRSEVHDFLALLAAHPAGLLASDIADKLHLAPGRDQNALKNLRRAVRRALRTPTGITAQEFILLHGELHKLHPDLVETDLADLNRSLDKASAAPDTEEARNETLAAIRDALAHYRGPFAQGSDYLWADTIREHLAMKSTDAALRLARQIEHPNTTPRERDAVLGLLEHLGTLHPGHECLAQHTIRLYQAAGRQDAARHTYTRLERHLTELDLEPEPGTQALITPRTRTRQHR